MNLHFIVIAISTCVLYISQRTAGAVISCTQCTICSRFVWWRVWQICSCCHPELDSATLKCNRVGLSRGQLSLGRFLSLKPCGWNGENDSFFNVCVVNTLSGVFISSKSKAKRHCTVWLSIFIFIRVYSWHIALATFNTLHVSWYCVALVDESARYIKPACYPSFSISIVKTHLKQGISICHPAGFGYSIQRRLSGDGSCSYTCVLVSHLHVCQRWELQLAGFFCFVVQGGLISAKNLKSSPSPATAQITPGTGKKHPAGYQTRVDQDI